MKNNTNLFEQNHKNNNLYDADKAWIKVDKMVARKRRMRFVFIGTSIAATLLLAMLVMPGLLNKTSIENKIATHTEFNRKATLILASGKRIDIVDSVQNSLYRIKEAADIIASSGNDELLAVVNTLKIPRGGKHYFELPDGTKVWLNSDTELEFPSEFVEETREVKLRGQAYFDVSHNPEKPFIVNTALGNVVVKGTVFDLKVYEQDNTFETTLVEGKVNLLVFNHETTGISPGQRAVFNKAQDELVCEEVDVSLYTSWVQGLFVFKNRSLEDITKELSRWYDVDFIFETEDLKRLMFTGQYEKNQALAEIMDLLSITGDINFKLDEDEIIVCNELRK